MREMRYGIFAEDLANRLFIESFATYFFQKLALENFNFTHDAHFADLTEGKNNDAIKTKFPNMVKIGVARFSLDFIFVALDLDINEGKLPKGTVFDEKFLHAAHQSLYETMELKAVDESVEKYVIFSIAVQCIEHWFYYLKNNVVSEEGETKAVEMIDRKRIKFEVYGGKVRNNKQLPIIQAILKDADFEYLRTVSNSFAHFYQKLEIYHNKISSNESSSSV
jgi:hypothetical protein